MEEGGIVPPHSVLAPGTALGLLPQQSPILRPGQLHCIKGLWSLESHRNKRRNDEPDSAGCSIQVAWQLEIPPVWVNSSRSVDAGLRREITKPGRTTLCMEWP